MGLRFRTSIKIAPGVKINLNKKSASITFGGKGYHKTFNSNGQTTTSVNFPVKGLYYTERKGSTSKKKSAASSRASSRASSPAAPVVSNDTSVQPSKEKKATVKLIVSDPPTVGVAVFGAIVIVVGFFVSGRSIPFGIIVALVGVYLIYAYIAHKKHPESGKYISEDQLQRWRQLLSVTSGTAYELSKLSLPVLLELKADTEKYCSQLPGSAEKLLDTQQKIVDFSEFVIIKGDNPQHDFDRYVSMIDKM